MEDFVATLLVQRGLKLLKTPKLLSSFLRPLARSYLMKIWKSGGTIEAAIENQENIMVLVITMSMEQPQYHWYLLI
jgi:hypothetical protein